MMEKELEEKIKRNNRFLHHTMAAVGGFMAGYAVLTKCDFLGNAQTANLVYLVMALLGSNLTEVMLRLFGVAIYFLGGFFYIYVKKRTGWDVRLVSIGIDAAAVLILGLLPDTVHVLISLYPIFFAMSFQWNAFPGEYGYASSTIFSTNNTRQVSLSLAEYFFDRDPKQLHKACFFAGSLLFFHIGVAGAYIAVQYLGVQGIWLNWLFLAAAAGLRYFGVQLSQNPVSGVRAHRLSVFGHRAFVHSRIRHIR